MVNKLTGKEERSALETQPPIHLFLPFHTVRATGNKDLRRPGFTEDFQWAHGDGYVDIWQ